METPRTTTGRPRDVENENLKPDSPPRPATEPDGADDSSRSDETKTDPGSGEPNEKADGA